MPLLPMSPALLIFHISTATIGLLSGFLTIAMRKGSGRHAAAGTVFAVSMLCMSGSAAFIATFMSPVAINVVAGLLTFYLVCTGWWAGRRRDGGTSAFDRVAFVFILAVGIGSVLSGVEAINNPGAARVRIPPPIYFVFGSVALLLAASDLRMLVRGGVVGARRIARHLWRMSLALLLATLSLYPGQARNLPPSLRETSLPYIPHIVLAGSMLFWMVRVLGRKRVRHDRVIEAKPANAMVRKVAA